MISEDKEIGFLESEVDRLENKIMPLRIRLDGYRHMLNKKRLEKGSMDLWDACGVGEGSRVIMNLSEDDPDALYEISGYRYSVKHKSVRVMGVRLLKSGNKPKYISHTDLGGIPWFAKNHKRQ